MGDSPAHSEYSARQRGTRRIDRMRPEHSSDNGKLAWSTPSVIELTTRATAGGNSPYVFEIPVPSFPCYVPGQGS